MAWTIFDLQNVDSPISTLLSVYLLCYILYLDIVSLSYSFDLDSMSHVASIYFNFYPNGNWEHPACINHSQNWDLPVEILINLPKIVTILAKIKAITWNWEMYSLSVTACISNTPCYPTYCQDWNLSQGQSHSHDFQKSFWNGQDTFVNFLCI